MAKLKIGVIGCGSIANAAHIPNYMKIPDEAEIKYFCDIIKERADNAVEKYGCGTAVEDYHTVINDPEIDAVDICTPNKMHSIIAIDALHAGKHVLCEKPAARIYSEAKAMQEAQAETGKILNIGVCCRFQTQVEEIKRCIAAGELGEVYHIFINFRAHRSIPGIGGAFTTKAISGGGVLIDWGVHRIDQVMYMLGDPKPLSVTAKTFSKIGCDIPNYAHRGMWSSETSDMNGTFDVEDSFTAFVRTDGPIITLEGAWAQNIEDGDDYLDFLGTKGGIRLKYCGNYTQWTVHGKAFHKAEHVFDNNDMYFNEIESFLNCVRTGERNRANIDSNILTSRIMQGIYDSSEQNREVVFED